MKKNNNIFSRRSFIFTPPFKKEMFKKASLTGVDIVCLELEDGIAPSDKVIARNLALEIIKENENINTVEKLIRINSIRESFGLSDMQAILDSNYQPDGIMMPKVKSSEEVLIIDSLLSERKLNTKLHIIIETNKGLKEVYNIASCCSRIEALFFGAVDMSAELRCKNSWNNLLYARSRVVHAAALNELDVIDVPFLDLEDNKTLEIEAIKARNLGFSGKGAIHPKQINILNKVFTPTKEKFNKAKKIIKLFENSSTGLVLFEGKLIEKPVLREMYRLVSIYERLN